MLKRLFRKSEYSRNVLTLMSGTVVAQAIPIAITPILTRLYSPRDFGVLALYSSVVAILGSIANARYELAVMLPDTDTEAWNVLAVGLGIVSLFSFVLLLIFGIFNSAITGLLGNTEVGPWLYLVPVSVFFSGLYNLLNYYANRKKKYKDLASASVAKTLAGTGVQLGGGLVVSGASGLIAGQITSSAVSIIRLYLKGFEGNAWMNHITWADMRRVAYRYRDFPKYSTPAILANSLNANLLNILISNIYAVITLGHYSLVQRVLGLPSVFIGNALGQVFFQRATEERRKTGLAAQAFDTTTKKLLIISLPIFVFLYFIIEQIFVIVFGEQWRVAGQYAKYLLPLYAIRLVVTPVSMLTSVCEKQRLSLLWQTGLLVLGLGVIMTAYYLGWPFVDFVRLYTVVITMHYLLLGILLWMVSRSRI